MGSKTRRRLELPRGIYVPLPPQAREALFDWADSEWRSPREQAAKFLVESLRAAGALPAEQTESDRSTEHAAVMAGKLNDRPGLCRQKLPRNGRPKGSEVIIPRIPTLRITPARPQRAIDSHHGPCAFSPASGRASRLTHMGGFLVADTCGGGQP